MQAAWQGVQEKGTGWVEGETFGYERFGCHFLARSGPVPGWHSAGTCVSSLASCGFTLLWIRSVLDLLLVPAEAGESQ